MGQGVYPLQEIQRLLEVHAEIEHLATDQVVSHHFIRPTTAEESERLPMLCAPGMLPIVHAGCGRDYYLSVSGTEQGYIWYRGHCWYPFPALDNHPTYHAYNWNDEDDEENFVEEDDGIFERWVTQLLSPQNTYRVTFLEWYILWLDESLQRWRRGIDPRSDWEDWFTSTQQ